MINNAFNDLLVRIDLIFLVIVTIALSIVYWQADRITGTITLPAVEEDDEEEEDEDRRIAI